MMMMMMMMTMNPLRDPQ